ncbi:MAG: HAD-IIIC family phosphatase [Alphaproteobacteria bacterium]|nr:HAD-IIIC family phosphatase [Alphaproteobacteria bacterium]
MKRLVVDLDNTLTQGEKGDYANALPRTDVINSLRDYQQQGFEIVIASSRNMRTHNNNLGKIIAETSPIIIEWLKKHRVPYDELWLGKPWCGDEGFYIDDRAIRPQEFITMSHADILAMLEKEKGS